MANARSALVFGGSGFLGSHVVDALLEAAYAVIVVDTKPPYQPNVKHICADILDDVALDLVDFDVDVIFNFIAQADIGLSAKFVEKTVNLNVLGNVKILERIKHRKDVRYVYASSAYASSGAGSFYGITKWASERLIKEYSKKFGLEFTLIRYGSVYGPRSDSSNRIYRLIEEALVHKRVTYAGTGDEEREYIHVKDAAQLSVQLLEDKYRNECLVLTGTQRLSYRQFLSMIQEMFCGTVEVNIVDSEFDDGHYLLTPYQFIPDTAKKLVLNEFCDIGQGLLDLVYEIRTKVRSQLSE